MMPCARAGMGGALCTHNECAEEQDQGGTQQAEDQYPSPRAKQRGLYGLPNAAECESMVHKIIPF
jgi:hypothetical protein